MCIVTVNKKNSISCEPGTNLYKLLCDNGYFFQGNCGGNGRCNACNVLITNKGQFVKSCRYEVTEDIEIYMDIKETNILADHSVDPGIVKDAIAAGDSKMPQGYGIAVDIGTTTIAMELIKLSDGSRASVYKTINSQTATGADVVSRINLAAEASGLELLHNMVAEDILKGVDELIKKTSISDTEISRICFSGNTAMTYILVGTGTECLASYPFKTKKIMYHGEDVSDILGHSRTGGVSLSGIPYYIAPEISAFVGGDISSGAAALGLYDSKKYRLLIDLGTNGEILLAGRDGGFAVSTACGPAFEGAFSGGLYGSTLFDYIDLYRRSGKIDENGIICPEYFDEGLPLTGDNVLTMDMVHDFLLAKAAIAGGIDTLIKEAGVSVSDIENIYISGGFGFHLDTDKAIRLGMFPGYFSGKTKISGNTSLAGSYLMLFRSDITEDIMRNNKKTEYINLAANEHFNKVFVDSMRLVLI